MTKKKTYPELEGVELVLFIRFVSRVRETLNGGSREMALRELRMSEEDVANTLAHANALGI